MINSDQDHMWFIVFLLLATLTAWLGWQNRAAEKVRSALVRGFAIGIVGILIASPPGGATGPWLRLSIVFAVILISCWIALNEDRRRVGFASVFFYNIDTKEPLESLNETYAYRFCQRTLSCPPEFVVSRMNNKTKADTTGIDTYFDVFLRMIVDLLFQMYVNTWDLKLIHRNMYSYRTVTWEPHDIGPLPSSSFLTREKVQSLFPDSLALRVENFGITGNKMAVPSGTVFDGKTRMSGESPNKHTLHLKNPYVDITIDVQFSSFTRGGLGDLRLLLGLSKDEEDKFSTCAFEVNLVAKFNQLKSGNPEMKRYKRWVDGIFEAIQDNFDANRHRERGKEWFMLKRLSAIRE